MGVLKRLVERPLIAVVVKAIAANDDPAALRLEKAAVRQTHNGWQEGDPLDQPDNPEPWRP